jgi:hypothetical protein
MPDCQYTSNCYSKPNAALRLHLAEPEPVKNTANIELGLKYWRELNATPNRWATFRAQQFAETRVVIVDWGHLYIEEGCNVYKEPAIETIIITTVGDKVYASKHANY